MLDAMLEAVSLLRSSLPPEEEGRRRPEHREVALRALSSLSRYLPLPYLPPLLPLQFEVLFRQLTHVLSSARVWEPSGTADAVLSQTVECLLSLLTLTPSLLPKGVILSYPQLASTLGALLSESLLIAASSSRSDSGVRKRCLAIIPAVYRLPQLDLDLAAFFLPGVASSVLHSSLTKPSSLNPPEACSSSLFLPPF